MKKELTIEMEEECLTCPKLFLTTVEDKSLGIKSFECIYLKFCRQIRGNWEEHMKKE